MKIVINTERDGSFDVNPLIKAKLGLTNDYILRNESFGISSDNFYAYRADKRLIQAIEELQAFGSTFADGHDASLKIVEFPDDREWEIISLCGAEYLVEKGMWRCQ